METSNFELVFSRLKKESKHWKNPFVTLTEGIEHTPFTTLISCLLSLRTKDGVTARASLRLLKKHDSPNKLLALSNKRIEELIYPVGFYKTKAKRIREICQTLIKTYHGTVPNDFEALLKLKGVGRKTANIVMCYGFHGIDFLPIDTHAHRIPNRLGWVKTKTPEQTEEALKKMLPKRYWHDFNDLFVRFGQNLCVPVSPFCSKCPVEKYCMKVGVKRER